MKVDEGGGHRAIGEEETSLPEGIGGGGNTRFGSKFAWLGATASQIQESRQAKLRAYIFTVHHPPPLSVLAKFFHISTCDALTSKPRSEPHKLAPHSHTTLTLTQTHTTLSHHTHAHATLSRSHHTLALHSRFTQTLWHACSGSRFLGFPSRSQLRPTAPLTLKLLNRSSLLGQVLSRLMHKLFQKLTLGVVELSSCRGYGPGGH